MKSERIKAKVAVGVPVAANVPAVANVPAESLLGTMQNVLEENDRLRMENAQLQWVRIEVDQLQAEVQANKARGDDMGAMVDLIESRCWYVEEPEPGGRSKRAGDGGSTPASEEKRAPSVQP
jgi:hypothetical protein